jgi:hypothetical protein
VERAKRLATIALQLQWVHGDAKKAEASFFKINQEASPIDKTELRLLKARTLPNSLAARAIVRSGTGHKYWSRFDEVIQAEIESQAKQINDLLFSPALRTPIKTLDLPVAGRGYSSQTLPLVFEFVNIANCVKSDKDLSIDTDGSRTLDLLKSCRRYANRITGVHPSSLGLHPAVYFYSATGRYQPTAFLAIVSLIRKIEEAGGFREFTECRQGFEAFLLRHKILVNQVVIKFGSGLKGLGRLEELLAFLLEKIRSGATTEGLQMALALEHRFSFLQPAERDDVPRGRDFDSDAKSAVFLREALKAPITCQICHGMIHLNSISTDHIIRRADGGLGAVDNGQLAHPYCNTTYKH